MRTASLNKMSTSKRAESRAFFIRNTKTRNRTTNLYDIAIEIDKLKREAGGIQKLKEEYADISPNMINRFLSVLKVDPSVQRLIKSKEIDNINAVYYMHTLPKDEQLTLCNLLIQNKINSADIRAYRPLKKRHPQLDTISLVNKLLETKDRRQYLIKFDVMHREQINQIGRALNGLLSRDDFKLSSEKSIGSLMLTKEGYHLMRLLANERNSSFKDYMNSIINGK